MYNFPDQTIPESQKTEQWHADHITGWVSFAKSSAYTGNKLEMEKLYYAYQAEIHPSEKNKIEKMITKRYCDSSLGPQYDIYPLIENTLEQLIGDYRLRPLKLYALTTNRDAIVSKLDEMYDAFLEKITRRVHEEINQEEGINIPTENPELQLPEDDDEDFFKNYRTKSEEVTEKILYMLLVVKKEKEKIYEGLLHYLITGAVDFVMAEKDGHPSITVVSPLNTDSDVDPHNAVQDNKQYFCHSEFIPLNDIYNNFQISPENKKKLDKYVKENSASASLRGTKSTSWFQRSSDNEELRLRVVSMIWKSRIVKYAKVTINDKGNEEMDIVSDDYKPRKKDKLKRIEVENIRHCTMIGEDVVLEYGILENQLASIGNKKKKHIHVVGLNTNNKTGMNVIRSIAKKLKFLQDYASEILYEIKIAMRQIDGGVLVYDLANIPKEWARFGINKAIEKVNYSIKKDRVMYINSADKKSNGYASAVNISQKSRISELTALLAVIEDLAQKISGINQTKMGQTADYAKTGVAQMNMLQASARGENIYGIFDTFIEKFLERLVLKAQHLYKENELISYYAGDKILQFIEVKQDFLDDDIGITLSDPRKEMDAKQMIDQAAQQLMPNAQQDPRTMLELIKLHMSDSASDAIAIFEKGVASMEKAMQERAQQAQAQAEAEQQAKAAAEQEKNNLQREGFANNLDVAKVYADNKLQSDGIKEANANLRKASELETKELIELRKNEIAKANKSNTNK